MSRYFIASTGTGVGKTFTTCALLQAMPQALAYKPIISGWEDTTETDTTQIIEASGWRQTIEGVSPWRFKAPLSPHRAAALEGRQLALEDIIAWSKSLNAPQVLIEGIGGIMVPVDNRHTTLDWMTALGWPVILTVGSYLGSISHTLTALSVLKQAGLSVIALVMNESEDSTVSFTEAQAGLEPFIQNIPLRIFQPRVSSWREAREIFSLSIHL